MEEKKPSPRGGRPIAAHPQQPPTTISGLSQQLMERLLMSGLEISKQASRALSIMEDALIELANLDGISRGL